MQKKRMEKVIKELAKYLVLCIEELREYKDTKEQAFQYGERVAYTECLECLQHLAKDSHCVPCFDIEKKYPL